MPEEQEDLNEFKRWDSVCATLFIASVPAVMFWVFGDHDIMGALVTAAIAVGLALFVLLLTFLFPERFVGRMVNLAGNIMAGVYVVLAVWLFYNKWMRDDTPAPEATNTQYIVPSAARHPGMS